MPLATALATGNVNRHMSMARDNAPLHRARAIFLVVLVAGLVALAWSEPVHRAVILVFEVARGIMQEHPVAGPLLFVILSALSAMLAFFSSAVLVPAAVYAWGPVASVALLWAGWMLGGVLSYALAYRFGQRALRWAAPGKSFSRYEHQLRRTASFGSIVLFQLALPSEIPGFVLGLVRYPIGRYLFALALVELPYAVGTTLLGVGFVSRRIGLLVSLGALVLLATVVLGRAWRRQFGRGPAG